MARAEGSFELASWDESPYEKWDNGAKLTRASVKQAFTGDIEGDGSVEWLMAYRPDGTAHFVGLQHIRGTLGGRTGDFVLETSGDFDGTMARWTASVVPATATGDLDGLVGQGRFGAPHGPAATFEIDYDFQ